MKEHKQAMAIDPRELPTLRLLDEMGISYVRYEHALALTMHDCEDIGRDIGAHHFKNLFLCNRQKTKYYLLLIAAGKQFHTADISKQLGVSRLSFCTEEQLMDRLGLLPGSVTPMALAHKGTEDITVIIDEDILSMDTVCVHPCVSSASLAIKLDDLVRFLAKTGNKICIVKPQSPEEA